MWKVVLIVATLAIGALLLSLRPKESTSPQARAVLPALSSVIPSEVPTAQPTLILTLSPEKLIHSAIKKEAELGEALKATKELDTPQPTPNLGALAQIDVTVNEKRKPVVHYYIAGKPEAKASGEEKH